MSSAAVVKRVKDKNILLREHIVSVTIDTNHEKRGKIEIEKLLLENIPIHIKMW